MAGQQNASASNVVGIIAAIAVAILVVTGAAVGFLMASDGDVSESAASSARGEAEPPSRPRASDDPTPRVRGASASVEVGSPPPKAQEVPATAEFELHGTRSGHKTSFYVLGYVKNTSEFAIRKPKLIVVLLDGDGKEVGTSEGFAEDDVVEPGERTPASVLVKDPPDHASFEIEVAPRRFSGFGLRDVSGLEVEAGEPTRASFGRGLEIAGRVHHRGSEPARFVKVQVLGFDAEDKLMGIHSTFADIDLLEPGSSARFSTRSMLFDADPARFELQASGRVAN